MPKLHVNTEHFYAAIEHAFACGFTLRQALVMSKGMLKHGLVDASAGYDHYALRVLVVQAASANPVRARAVRNRSPRTQSRRREHVVVFDR